MSWAISTDVGDIDLEDSSILEIERSSDGMKVSLDFARIWRPNVT